MVYELFFMDLNDKLSSNGSLLRRKVSIISNAAYFFLKNCRKVPSA